VAWCRLSSRGEEFLGLDDNGILQRPYSNNSRDFVKDIRKNRKIRSYAQVVKRLDEKEHDPAETG
jgi:hypothetical protein